jgi:HD-like signal output (HDOD) protein
LTTINRLLTERDLMAASERLTPLPAAAARLMTMLGNDDVNMRDVANVIAYDPALTAALMRQANSATSASSRIITNPRDAVMRLGLATVLTVAIRTAAGPTLQRALPAYGYARGDVFAHSIRAAAAAEVLVTLSPSRVPSSAPTAALLHDIGKVLISEVLGDRAVALVAELAARDEIALTDAESEVFGTHHAQVCSHVVRRWNLPVSFLEGLVNHHAPAAECGSLSMAVQLADTIAHRIQHNSAVERPEPSVGLPEQNTALCCVALGIDPYGLDAVTEQARMRYEAIIALVG